MMSMRQQPCRTFASFPHRWKMVGDRRIGHHEMPSRVVAKEQRVICGSERQKDAPFVVVIAGSGEVRVARGDRQAGNGDDSYLQWGVAGAPEQWK